MKRTFAKLLSLFVVLTLVIAMLPAVFAAGEAVSAGKTTLAVGEDTTISVTDASGAPVPNVKLSSSPADIVEISNMDVTAKKVGTAVITATVTEGETTRTLGSVTITVQSAVNAITPASSAVEIDADGESKTFSLSVTLTGAASGDRTEIVEGLSDGDVVAVGLTAASAAPAAAVERSPFMPSGPGGNKKK